MNHVVEPLSPGASWLGSAENKSRGSHRPSLGRCVWSQSTVCDGILGGSSLILPGPSGALPMQQGRERQVCWENLALSHKGVP